MRRGLTCCFGGSLVALITAALLLFVGLPALLQYLTIQDRQPIFDIQGISQRYRIGPYDVILIDILDCAVDACHQIGQTNVTFQVVRHGAEPDSEIPHNLSLLPGQTVSEILQLDDGMALRVISAQPQRDSDQKDVVRFQAFLPPE